MNYIYRYIDTADNIIKYIGIVCRDTENALEKRIYEHSYLDSWCHGKSWKIEYITVPTKNDAHALEGHFIALYGTNLQGHYNAMRRTMMAFGMPISEINMEYGQSEYVDIYLDY